MKTLIHVVPSGEWGGKERYAFDICRHYSSSGWNVRVLTRDARAVDGHFSRAGIVISHAPLRNYPDYYSAWALARLFKLAPKGKGIVHVHRYNDALTCILARRLARRPDIRLVYTRHKSVRPTWDLLRRMIYSGIDAHLFVSEFAKNNFFSGRLKLGKEKTYVTYNSLLESLSEPLPESAKGPIVAAYRGGLKAGKGLETLIEAMGLLKHLKIRLHIMGRGHPDYVDTLRRRASMAGITDRIDWIKNADFVEERMKAVHFGVLPSEVPEAFGMANLEFMAFGKPQISSFSGAEMEMLTPGEDSLRVSAGNPEQLAEAMKQLAENQALRLQMGEKALTNYTTRFSWPVFIKQIDKIYFPKKS